eukprot:TRINITY_DN9038_c0_g1_i1.p1 TRINITY_DN9038_c0_g1~~TRINITY_DN9038_c0_g1_i1.p1  ORF type:complete len:1772 (-),score=512.93 TRINITY_DN9038_c0_g1_i1:20-5335(-)
MEDDEEFDDWDAEFGFDDGDGYSDDTNTENLLKGSRIVGITADRLDPLGPTDDWGDDFQMDDLSDSVFKKNLCADVGMSISGKSGEKPKDQESDGATFTFGDDDEEDWDEEFGIDVEEKPQSLLSSLLPSKEKEQEKQELLPDKHRFLQDKSSIRIVKFPMPTLLFSLKEKDNHRVFVSDKEMCQWLGAVVSKHKTDNLRTIPSADIPIDIYTSNFHKTTQAMEKPSPEWFRAEIHFCTSLSRRKEEERCWQQLVEVFKVLEKSNKEDLLSLAKDVASLLYLAAKLYNVERAVTFEHFCSVLKELSSEASVVADLLLTEANAHYSEDAEAAKMYTLIFARISAMPDKSEHKAMGMVRLLSGMHLFMSGYSPLTAQKHRNCDAQEDLYYASSSLAVDESARTLLEADKRIAMLEEWYPRIDLNLDKAKAAFSLALHAREQGKNQVAERRFFESLYILDEHITAGCLPLIVSEFGSHCLRGYGDMLMYNYKYKYGILAYHECSVNYFLRRRSKEYFQLLKEMASTAIKHDDVKRGVVYYREVLQLCIDEGKTNEMLYVSEILSKIYTEIGRFQVAEEFLLGAFSMLGPNDPQAFNLRLKLAQVYLKGFHPERGVALLTVLLESNPPKTKKLQVISALIKAHLRKRQYDAAVKFLRLYVDADSGAGHTRKRSATSNMSSSSLSSQQHRIADRTLSAGVGGNTIRSKKKSATYYELEAMNFYHALRFPEAISAINSAIELCSHHNLRTLGKYFYVRGKFFQSLCSGAVSLVFPTTLVADGEERPPVDAVFFRSKGDIMQETIATFRKAYEYFGAAGDEVGLCKTVSRIAETYLDMIFPFVGLLQRPYDSVSEHALFTPTAIAEPSPARTSSDTGSASSEPAKFVITCAHISGPATLALNIATELSDPLTTLKSYLNIAELRFLEEDTAGAFRYWSECRDALVSLFLLPVLGKSTTPASMLRKLWRLTSRLVRFMFTMESETINKHLFLIDALNELEVRISISERRQIPPIQRDGSDLNLTTRIHALKPTVKMASSTPLMKIFAKTQSAKKSAASKLSAHRSTRRITRQSTVKNVRHLFNVEEEILKAEHSWSALPSLSLNGSSEKLTAVNGDGIGSEDTAELAWNCLHCAKSLLARFSEGKMTKEDVFNMNQKYIRKLSKAQVDRYTGYSPLLNPPVCLSEGHQSKEEGQDMEETVPSGVSFDTLVHSFRRLRRAMYVVKLGGFVCAFVPYTGEKRIRTLGANDHHTQEGGTTRASESDASGASEKRLFYIKVSLTSTSSDYATFTVRRGVTMQALLDFIIDLPNSGLAVEADGGKKSGSSTKRLFNSFSRNTARSMKAPIRFIDGSKNFTQEVATLSAMCESNSQDVRLHHSAERRSSISTVSFATRTRQGQDSYLLPMTGSLGRTFEQCFPMEDSSPSKPLSLFLFLTAMSPSVSELLNTTSELRGDHFSFSDDTLSFMSAIVEGSDQPEALSDSYSRVLIEGVLANSFRWIVGMLPEGGVKHRKRVLDDFPFQDAILKHGALKTLPRNPLSFVCSPSLQGIPWELVFGEMIVRYFGLGHAVNREHYLKEERFVANTLTLPSYHACCYASYDKALSVQEEMRKRHLVDCFKGSLQMLPHTVSIGEVATLPFHNPILRPIKARPAKTMKKKKLKMMNSIDLRQFADDPAGLLTIPESLRPHEYPVFLLSYTDLMEQVEATFELLSWASRCSFIFVPISAMKEVSARLMRIQDRYAREVERVGYDLAANQYQYMMTVISTIQSELSSPIVVVNTP